MKRILLSVRRISTCLFSLMLIVISGISVLANTNSSLEVEKNTSVNTSICETYDVYLQILSDIYDENFAGVFVNMMVC